MLFTYNKLLEEHIHHGHYEIMYSLCNVHLFNLIGVVSKKFWREVCFQTLLYLNLEWGGLILNVGNSPQSPVMFLNISA